jgi:hypothetical protein
MKHRAVLAILACATALSFFPELPCASAQETLNFLRYVPGTGGTRQPRTSNGGQFMKFASSQVGIPNTPGATISVQTSFQTPYPSTTQGIQYVLSYVNILGGANGGINVNPDANGIMPQTTNVTLQNTSDPTLIVNAYYYPEGGTCPPGQVCGTAYIDQFDDVLGSLESDTFVNVYTTPPPTASPTLTKTGNVDGYVTTGTSAVQIDAIQTTAQGRIFDEWSGGPGGTINGNNLSVGKGITLYEFAHYHSKCPNGLIWSSGATVSQCVTPSCPKGEYWSAEYNQCIQTCPSGDYWNVTTKKCVTIGNPNGEHCNMKCPAGTSCYAVAFECDCICGVLNPNTGWHTSTQQ